MLYGVFCSTVRRAATALSASMYREWVCSLLAAVFCFLIVNFVNHTNSPLSANAVVYRFVRFGASQNQGPR